MSTALAILKNNGLESEKPVEEQKEVNTTKPENLQTTDDEDLPDDKLIAMLQKRGVKVSSVEDLSKLGTPPEQQAPLTAEQKAAAARKYAIDNNIFDQATLQSYEADVAKGEELAFDLFKENFLENIKGTAEEGTYTEEDLREEYTRMNYLDEEDNSPKKKLRQKEIQRQLKQHLDSKYGKVLNAEQEYDSHQDREKKAQQYKGTVTKALSLIPKKLQFTVDGVTPVEYEPTAETLKLVKQFYLEDPTAFANFGEQTAENIAAAMQKVIAGHELPTIVKEAAEAYSKNKFDTLKKGRQGIIERGVGSNTDDDQPVVNTRARAYLEANSERK